MEPRTFLIRDVAAVPEIPLQEIVHLWSNDFYDGFLVGMAEWRGTRYFYDLIDYDRLGSEDEGRSYWSIVLTPEQLRDEEAWHESFCRNVGTHFDFTGRPAPIAKEMRPSAFYTPYNERASVDYGSNPVVGWFRFWSSGDHSS